MYLKLSWTLSSYTTKRIELIFSGNMTEKLRYMYKQNRYEDLAKTISMFSQNISVPEQKQFYRSSPPTKEFYVVEGAELRCHVDRCLQHCLNMRLSDEMNH